MAANKKESRFSHLIGKELPIRRTATVKVAENHLDKEDQAREWAQENYEAGQFINPAWNEWVKDECECINAIAILLEDKVMDEEKYLSKEMREIVAELKKAGASIIGTTIESLDSPVERKAKRAGVTEVMEEVTFDSVEVGVKIKSASGKAVYEIIGIEVSADGKRTIISRGPNGKEYKETKWNGRYYKVAV